MTVVCGEPDFDDDCLRNPTFVIEVISPSSGDYGRGEKFRNYRQFGSLQHYLLVEQDEKWAQYCRRVEGFLWEPVGTYSGDTATIPLPERGIELPLMDLYRRIP